MPPISRLEVYAESRGETGPPTVLVHGSPGDLRDWEAVVRLLSRDCRVTTYDRRGHGPIERLLPRGTMAEEIADLVAVIDAGGIKPAHVVGMSAGAIVVLHLLIERPDLFASATIHEPPLYGLVEDEGIPEP